MSSIRIGGIEKFSIVDFPNRMAAVVFMQGCPWRCPFCHNSHLQDVNAETNIVWRKFLVVFSGGEPLVQENLVQAMEDVKAMGYQIGLHTGGYHPKRFEKFLPAVDWVGFDVKAPFDEERYKVVTGGIADVARVLESLQMLIAKIFEYR